MNLNIRMEEFQIEDPHNPERVTPQVQETYNNFAIVLKYCEENNIPIPLKIVEIEKKGLNRKIQVIQFSSNGIGQKNIYYEYISTQIIQYLQFLKYAVGIEEDLIDYLKPSESDIEELLQMLDILADWRTTNLNNRLGLNLPILWACCITLNQYDIAELKLTLSNYKNNLSGGNKHRVKKSKAETEA